MPSPAALRYTDAYDWYAARWLKLSQDERECTGVTAPSHELREGINAHIRERLVREGRLAGRASTPPCGAGEVEHVADRSRHRAH